MTFRTWLQNLWYENCEERMNWGSDKLTLSEYFRQYKWWLRREYRFQQRNNK